MTVTPESNPIVRFPAVQEEIGDVVIYDDGDEATVCIENITHEHFNPYDDSLDEFTRDGIISETVIDFLKALFRDEVLLSISADKRCAGWIRLDHQAGPAQLSSGHKYFLWSKPYRAVNSEQGGAGNWPPPL